MHIFNAKCRKYGTLFSVCSFIPAILETLYCLIIFRIVLLEIKVAIIEICLAKKYFCSMFSHLRLLLCGTVWAFYSNFLKGRKIWLA